MKTRKFWPLDSDLEGQIYENVAWDLPGFRCDHPTRRSSPRAKSKPKQH
jgi:hypothetical protein